MNAHSWQDLKDLFKTIGDVGFADVTDKSRGEGVVEFSNKVRYMIEHTHRDIDRYRGRDSCVRVCVCANDDPRSTTHTREHTHTPHTTHTHTQYRRT